MLSGSGSHRRTSGWRHGPCLPGSPTAPAPRRVPSAPQALLCSNPWQLRPVRRLAIPENMNVELSHKLSEREEGSHRRERWETVVEIIEVVVLAVVAVATAWTGFQASRWDGRQSYLYGHASSLRFQADAASTYGGQELSADAGIFTAWLEAEAAHNVALESQFSRRFTPDFAVAFEAWLKTTPSPTRRPRPARARCPSTRTPISTRRLSSITKRRASSTRAPPPGTLVTSTCVTRCSSRSVLFLVALAQRLKVREAHIGLNVVAFGLLVFVLASVLTLPAFNFTSTRARKSYWHAQGRLSRAPGGVVVAEGGSVVLAPVVPTGAG